MFWTAKRSSRQVHATLARSRGPSAARMRKSTAGGSASSGEEERSSVRGSGAHAASVSRRLVRAPHAPHTKLLLVLVLLGLMLLVLIGCVVVVAVAGIVGTAIAETETGAGAGAGAGVETAGEMLWWKELQTKRLCGDRDADKEDDKEDEEGAAARRRWRRSSTRALRAAMSALSSRRARSVRSRRSTHAEAWRSRSCTRWSSFAIFFCRFASRAAARPGEPAAGAESAAPALLIADDVSTLPCFLIVGVVGEIKKGIEGGGGERKGGSRAHTTHTKKKKKQQPGTSGGEKNEKERKREREKTGITTREIEKKTQQEGKWREVGKRDGATITRTCGDAW